MLLYIQRVFLNILLPPAGPLFLALVGYLLYRKSFKKVGRYCIIAGIVMLYLFSTPVVSNLLIRPLEDDHPPLRIVPEETHTIVVLTAGVKDLSHIGIGSYPENASIARLEHAVTLFMKSNIDLFIISGGKGDPAHADLSIGKSLERVALNLGVPDNILVIEDTSRNTYESARQLRRLLNEERNDLILVTSAFHMKRSVKFYEQAGFRVIPAPTDYYGEPIHSFFHALIPSAKELLISATALYEYLVRLRYFIF